MSQYSYSIKNNRLKNASLSGFSLSENGTLRSLRKGSTAVLMPIDGGSDDALWGRLSFHFKASDSAAIKVYVACVNNYISPSVYSTDDYLSLMKRMGARRYTGMDDILLYSFTGRYLCLMFTSAGDGEIEISGIKVDRVGDNFMQTLPEVYQERDSFLHRFMSVFSSVYNDLEEEIDALPGLLDVDTCPVQLLHVYAGWLGMDVGDGFLSEAVLRKLVKEAPVLNRMKGTKWCLSRITEIILGEPGVIVERNNSMENMKGRELSDFNHLYGDSMFDVTIMVKTALDERSRSQLQYILDQYIPVRCRIRIVQLGSTGVLDGHTYLDVNAQVYSAESGELDSGRSLDSMITLD